MQQTRHSAFGFEGFPPVLLLLLIVVCLMGCSTEPLPLDTHVNPLLKGPLPIAGKEELADNTPFGNYVFLLKLKVNQRFLQILKDETLVSQQPGKVIVIFRLWYNGTITGLKVTNNEVGEQFASSCKRAVAESAPFAPWPPEMKKWVGRPYQDIRNTFKFAQ